LESFSSDVQEELHADAVDFESVEELGELSLDPPGDARVQVFGDLK
jgi:hypothetical protein